MDKELLHYLILVGGFALFGMALYLFASPPKKVQKMQ